MFWHRLNSYLYLYSKLYTESLSCKQHSETASWIIIFPCLHFYFPSLLGKQNKHRATGVLIDYSMMHQKFQEWLSKVINFFFFSFFRSNFLRLCILKVTQQSEKHLDKILNVDEFLKRIYSVIYSNDPVARAITVRYCK